MNPMPMPSMLSEAQLLVMLLAVVTGILSLIGFVLWAARHAYQERQRLRCPVRLRMATVLFGLAPDGRRTDVLRCTVFRKRPAITCGKGFVCAFAPSPVTASGVMRLAPPPKAVRRSATTSTIARTSRSAKFRALRAARTSRRSTRRLRVGREDGMSRRTVSDEPASFNRTRGLLCNSGNTLSS